MSRGIIVALCCHSFCGVYRNLCLKSYTAVNHALSNTLRRRRSSSLTPGSRRNTPPSVISVTVFQFQFQFCISITYQLQLSIHTEQHHICRVSHKDLCILQMYVKHLLINQQLWQSSYMVRPMTDVRETRTRNSYESTRTRNLYVCHTHLQQDFSCASFSHQIDHVLFYARNSQSRDSIHAH